ncbi:MAG: CarD family transcriptional regulator [Desulfobacterota bacterium]|nr:CarD family transcriptional regulator [Thermodesulfobacteriota bacterium]
MFKVGDKAVYPTHGVGVIEAIEERELAKDKKQKFYVLRILGNGMTIMIPTDKVDQVGLRSVISTKEALKVYKILKDKKTKTVDSQTWNRRYREYMERIKTGSVYEVASVLRDLFLLKVGKELSFGERRLMDIAKNLLVKELAIAQKLPEHHVERNITSIFEN